MSIKFYQDTERGIVNAESNRVYRLLKNRPNPLMTPTTFSKMSFTAAPVMPSKLVEVLKCNTSLEGKT